ncbi:hypothetical protein BACCIP111883_01199 [Sutcliffiella rhizosphaerae]|uniref:Uncharacterized protein n=1 Tax=Sutcliffiella rhizosphaerae TaxID=2880967 RepID=A0ABN8A5P3_9BACI|nr:hypothetical protein BACCIP111883_01199 [Sutcliffiella rhizosphaerae]
MMDRRVILIMGTPLVIFAVSAILFNILWTKVDNSPPRLAKHMVHL